MHNEWFSSALNRDLAEPGKLLVPALLAELCIASIDCMYCNSTCTCTVSVSKKNHTNVYVEVDKLVGTH